LTTQTDCDASLEDDAEGDACMALGCAYTHGSLGAGSVAFTTEDGTAVSTADDDWGRTDTPDFEAVSGRLEFRVNEVEATTTIDVTALVDGVYDEVDKSFRIRLSAPESTADSTGHVQLHLADDTDLLVAEVTIVDTELCAGWPAELPVRALEPCSYSERDDSSINCTARGLCPADDPDLQQHPEHPDTCTFVCAEGYDQIGEQPRCDGTSMSSTFQCRQQESTVGFAADSLAVQVNEGGTATLTVTRVGTERVCAAKDPSTITCEQPANDETVCPNSADCAFTADPSGGSQGSCSLTTQTDCDASLEDDAEGDACMALGCAYTHGSLGAGSVSYSTVDSTALSYAVRSPSDHAQGIIGSDFDDDHGVIVFSNNQVSASIDITTSVDDAHDEPPEVFVVALSNMTTSDDSTGHPQMHWAAAEQLVASVTIVDGQECSGWPPLLPPHAKYPCTVEERLAEIGTSRACVAVDAEEVDCQTPLDGATACIESADYCVFLPPAEGGTQGTCVLSTQAECSAALLADDDGTTCRAIKCEYTPEVAPLDLECDLRGNCPASWIGHQLALDVNTSSHLHNCSIVCHDGFRPAADAVQPACVDGALVNEFACEEIAEVIAAALVVEFAPELAAQVVAEGTPERKQFEADFSAGVSTLLGVSVDRVKVTGVSVVNTTAAGSPRRLQDSGEGSDVEVQVDFVVLPDPTTGTNEGSYGSVATVLVRELSAPGVAICPAECAACDATSAFVTSGGGSTSSCCQVSDPDASCARSYSAAAGIVQSADQVADLLNLLQEQPGTRTVRVTLEGLDINGVPVGTDSRRNFIALFEADMASLLGVDALRIRVFSVVAHPDGALIEFLVLADDSAADTQYSVDLLEEHLGSALHPLGQPSPMIAGYPATGLDYEGREGSKLGMLVGTVAGCLLLAAAVCLARRKRKQKVAGMPYKVGGDKSNVFVPDENMFEVSDDEKDKDEESQLQAPPRKTGPLAVGSSSGVGAASTLSLPGATIPQSPFPIGENPLDLAPIVRRECVRNQRAEDVARSSGMMGP